MWSNIFGARGVELTDTAALTPAVVAGLGTLFSNLAKRTQLSSTESMNAFHISPRSAESRLHFYKTN